MTLENLLNMATGLKCQDSYRYGWRGLEEMAQSPDWVQFMREGWPASREFPFD